MGEILNDKRDLIPPERFLEITLPPDKRPFEDSLKLHVSPEPPTALDLHVLKEARTGLRPLGRGEIGVHPWVMTIFERLRHFAGRLLWRQ